MTLPASGVGRTGLPGCGDGDGIPRSCHIVHPDPPGASGRSQGGSQGVIPDSVSTSASTLVVVEQPGPAEPLGQVLPTVVDVPALCIIDIAALSAVIVAADEITTIGDNVLATV